MLVLKLLAHLVEKGEMSDRTGRMGPSAVDVATGHALGRRIRPQEQDLMGICLRLE